MFTKNDIEEALKQYDRDRSIWNVGLFLATVDYFSTPFYYALKKFYQNTLQDYPSNQALSDEHLEDLKKMLEELQVFPNSFNSHIVDLYDRIYNLANPRYEVPDSYST